jgi:hypothetical protein
LQQQQLQHTLAENAYRGSPFPPNRYLPGDNSIYNSILLKFQNKLELCNYNQHKKQQLATNKSKLQQEVQNAVEMDDLIMTHPY